MYNVITDEQKYKWKGVKMSGEKKMGRPIIGKPKDIRLTIRVDEDTYSILVNKCEQKKISQSEYIRQLIQKNK